VRIKLDENITVEAKALLLAAGVDPDSPGHDPPRHVSGSSDGPKFH